jgi:hypothetical protein
VARARAKDASASPLPIASQPLAAFVMRQAVCQPPASKSRFFRRIVMQAI